MTSDYEAVIEINYTAKIMTGWTITPDFQYIWHPGGGVEDENRTGERVEDAVVVGVRTNLSF